MNGLTLELHQLVTELVAAGVPATVDPGEVLGMVTRGGVCALVEPHEDTHPGMGMATLEFNVPVRLVTAGPNDMNAVERLDEALLLAMPVAGPLEPATRGTWDAAGADLPSITLTARRRIPYPLVVHP
jgi:hypothetical protein